MSLTHKKLFHVKEQVRGGVHPVEEFAQDVLWSAGNNIISSERAVRPITGHEIMAPRQHTETIRGMLELEIGGTDNLFFGSRTQLTRFTSGLATSLKDVTPAVPFAALADDRQWDFEEFMGYVYACSGTAGKNIYKIPDSGAPPISAGDVFIEATTGYDDLEGARMFSKLGPHLMAFNTDLDPAAYHWCDAGDSTTWGLTTANSAGVSRINEMGSEIKATTYLGGGIAVYGEDELFLIRYIGHPLYFGHQPLLTGVGAFGQKAVVSLGMMNYGMGPKGIWKTDGMQLQYIDRPAVYNLIYSNLNRDVAHLCHIWHSPADQLLVFFWPSKDSLELDQSIAYQYVDQTWWSVNFIRSASSKRKAFPYGITGDLAGSIYRQRDTQQGTAPGVETAEPFNLDTGGIALLLGEDIYQVRQYGDGQYGEGDYGDISYGVNGSQYGVS